MESKAGILYLVGTPIGNLGDITLRALETLRQADLIAAEDTRQTKKLLTHYAIHKPLTSYFEHNKKSKGQALREKLRQGKLIALVTDAGLPGISDPGSDLVKECIDEGIKVTVIPGPSALLTALVASGLSTDGFVYAGFFPRQKKERIRILEELSQEARTIIFYESPHRLCSSLEEIQAAWGNRSCCVARELTKMHEEYKRGRISEVLEYYRDREIKGEITLLISGVEKTKRDCTWEEIEQQFLQNLEEGMSRKDAVKETAKTCGVAKRELYNRVMRPDK